MKYFFKFLSILITKKLDAYREVENWRDLQDLKAENCFWRKKFVHFLYKQKSPLLDIDYSVEGLDNFRTLKPITLFIQISCNEMREKGAEQVYLECIQKAKKYNLKRMEEMNAKEDASAEG